MNPCIVGIGLGEKIQCKYFERGANYISLNNVNVRKGHQQ